MLDVFFSDFTKGNDKGIGVLLYIEGVREDVSIFFFVLLKKARHLELHKEFTTPTMKGALLSALIFGKFVFSP